ncbi:hypothetical protein [Pseudomonas mohnii]
MPIDLRVLPERREPPSPPGTWRWCLVVLACVVLGAGLMFLLWPRGQAQMSLWFWCCVVVFPLMSGLLLFAFRRLVYERQRDFADSWNQGRRDQEQGLIKLGQRRLALLTTSYCTAAANNRLAQALRNGSKPLQPVYLDSLDMTLRTSQLAPAAQLYTQDEYTQRLTTYFHQIIGGFDEDIQRVASTSPLRLRIKHNQVLGDEQVLSLWRQCAGEKWAVDQVEFVTQNDGLLWLDTWLDELSPSALVLSLEIHLFLHPVVEQAESVSAVLLAQPQWCARQNLAPAAWVHRPVAMTDGAESFRDVLLWGQSDEADKSYFSWQLQVSVDHLRAMDVAMSATGHPLANDRHERLDESFGLPGRAVGNIALVVASENAVAQSQPQLILLQDSSPQWCFVQPAG